MKARVLSFLPHAVLPFVLGAAGDAKQDSTGDRSSCRVAVCLSGHLRSFVYPIVHQSIRHNLVDAIEAEGCQVDVFAYPTLLDATPAPFKQSINNATFTPRLEDVEVALNALGPSLEVQWHQEQAGIIPNRCPQETMIGQASYRGDQSRQGLRENGRGSHADGGAVGNDVVGNSRWDKFGATWTENLYWQLYKSLAAFRMAEKKERDGNFRYTWVVRTRFDLAWFRLLPPLRKFSQESVWFARYLWPLADPFALVPRHLADGFFSAVSSYYSCDGESWPPSEYWWSPSCVGGGFSESVLLRHMVSRGIPHLLYDHFEYLIVRGGDVAGPQRELAATGSSIGFSVACSELEILKGTLRDGYSRVDCADALKAWVNLRAKTLLLRENLWKPAPAAAIVDVDHRSWERLLGDTHIHSGTESPPEEPEESPNGSEAPSLGELEKVKAAIRALGKAIIIPKPFYPTENNRGRGEATASQGGDASIDRTEGSDDISSQTTRPSHVLIDSPRSCEFDQRAVRVPHRISSPEADKHLAREAAVAIKCLALSLGGGEVPTATGSARIRRHPHGLSPASPAFSTAEAKQQVFEAVENEPKEDGCKGARSLLQPALLSDAMPPICATQPDLGVTVGRQNPHENRSLEMVMMDVSIGISELGICSGSNDGGRPIANLDAFYQHPERHCVWYGRLHVDK